MAFRFDISLPDSEKNLHEWARELMKDKKLSASDIFRDALLEKKKEWDVLQSVSPEQLINKVKSLEKKVVSISEVRDKAINFIENAKLGNDWIAYLTAEKEKHVIERHGFKIIKNEVQQ